MSVRTYRRDTSGPAVLFAKADWCPHCKTAKPEIRKAAAILGSVVPVYELDSDKHQESVEELGVQGFPTIFFLDARGKLKEYKGERKGQKIADWACAHSGHCG